MGNRSNSLTINQSDCNLAANVAAWSECCTPCMQINTDICVGALFAGFSLVIGNIRTRPFRHF